LAPYAFVGTLLSIIGYSAMVALMGGSGITVGEAIVRGAKSIPTFIAVFILFLIVYMIAVFVVFLPLALLGMLGSAGAVIGGILGFVAAIAVSIFVIARFSVVLPVIILEETLNPITAIMRSWKLTAPKKWAITGFWALILVVYVILAMIVGGIVGVARKRERNFRVSGVVYPAMPDCMHARCGLAERANGNPFTCLLR